MLLGKHDSENYRAQNGPTISVEWCTNMTALILSFVLTRKAYLRVFIDNITGPAE